MTKEYSPFCTLKKNPSLKRVKGSGKGVKMNQPGLFQ